VSGWSSDELRQIGDSTELELASCGADGNLEPFTTMWVVSADGELYVRSAGGADRPWYRQALKAGQGAIRAVSIEADVTFEDAPTAPHAVIDAAYHAKYDRFGPGPVGHVTGTAAHPNTIRLTRRTS
jgi:hypothetical protein